MNDFSPQTCQDILKFIDKPPKECLLFVRCANGMAGKNK